MQVSQDTYIIGNNIPNEISFSKIDIWGSIIAGGLIALLSLPVLKNIGFFETSFMRDSWFAYVWLPVWFVAVPLVSLLGLYGSYRLGFKWPVVFKIGKYGIIGLLNTFLSAGISNLFILITGIAAGWWVDVFFAIAFAITITHSFFWNKFWTFRAHDTNNGKSEYARFFSVTTTTSLINIFVLHILINSIGAPQGIDPKVWANIALVILVPIAFLGNFFGYKFFVFKH